MSSSIPRRDPTTGRILPRDGVARATVAGERRDAGAAAVVDPDTAAAEPGAGAAEPPGGTKRKRGRPRTRFFGAASTGSASPGAAKPAAQKSASLDLTSFTAIWAGVHLQLARIADTPELAMSEAEARQFLVAWQNYLRHHSVAATQRTIDLMTAVGITAFIYAPRVVAVMPSRRRRRAEAAARAGQQEGPRNVFAFAPVPAARPFDERAARPAQAAQAAHGPMLADPPEYDPDALH
jgi:hypothetical protein